MGPTQQLPALHVALLTAGRDKPYAFGIGMALISQGFALDIIGGDDLDIPQWRNLPHTRFLNMRGNMEASANIFRKAFRILDYYVRLIVYALRTDANVFHILWNNKFEAFDRVLLMLYYKLLGKRVVLTVHNVNAKERDSTDSWWNRLTLKIQYYLLDHLFVHTERMKRELGKQFHVPLTKISVIPFGINNAVPDTDLSPMEAKKRLGIEETERVILFFGNIAPYKGLEILIDAFRIIMSEGKPYRLIIAGNPKNCESYWTSIQSLLNHHANQDRILRKIEYVPDDETEVYFKASDLVVLPYRHIFQSGVLSLGYSFGLPVVATDVGALRDDIIEGETGYVCRPDDAEDMAKVIVSYFTSTLYLQLNSNREKIREYARQRYSWDEVRKITAGVYNGVINSGSRISNTSGSKAKQTR